ncbi:MAG: flap endonuclease-1 [Candidatus ainarchaeum sp.]|nr:flap endonuclease-1 [Candidatus ainarchaeum sp.]MDD3976036.1 flap endonuclease-1 [Candidatus ainarchaeum sp.]
MGVAIGSLIKEYKQEFKLTKEFKLKKFGFDSYNILYQFLTSIRGIDGEPLKNLNGEVTSHLNGLFYRLLNLMTNNIDLYFVFDGKSNYLKQKTKDRRQNLKEKAKEKLEQATIDGNMPDIFKFSRQIVSLNKKIINESKELLLAMGVSYIDAPSEAEAQISYMTSKGILDYTVSQDYDSLLFNSPNLLRNLTVSGKKKIPYKNIYIDIQPEIIYSKELFEKLNISREKLIWLSILIGTDFNDKVEGIGPKTALKIVKEYNSFEDINSYLKSKNKNVSFDYKEIQDIFLNPNINKNPEIIKGKFDENKIRNILIDKANFSEERINNTLNKFIIEKEEKEKQKSLSKWF